MDFIERWFDVSPDGGSGRLEITSIIVALVVVAAPFLIIKFGSHPGWKPSLRSARLSLTESMTTRWIKGRKPSTGCAPWRACPSIPANGAAADGRPRLDGGICWSGIWAVRGQFTISFTASGGTASGRQC